MMTTANEDNIPPEFDSSRYDGALDFLRSALPGLQAVYLYGSRARGQTHQASDVDLAVLAAEPVPPRVRWEMQEALANMLHADVDLMDLFSASTVMRAKVVTTGLLLFEEVPYVRQCFEMTTLSAYALLNEERRAILDDVHLRGRVYGG